MTSCTLRTPKCFFDICVEDIRVGRIFVELFWNEFPDICSTFVELCTKDNHILKSYSIYCTDKSILFTTNQTQEPSTAEFQDETVAVAGSLMTTCKNLHTFCVAIPSEASFQNHVTFGKIIEGTHVIRAINSIPRQNREMTTPKLRIVDAGKCLEVGQSSTHPDCRQKPSLTCCIANTPTQQEAVAHNESSSHYYYYEAKSSSSRSRSRSPSRSRSGSHKAINSARKRRSSERDNHRHSHRNRYQDKGTRDEDDNPNNPHKVRGRGHIRYPPFRRR